MWEVIRTARYQGHIGATRFDKGNIPDEPFQDGRCVKYLGTFSARWQLGDSRSPSRAVPTLSSSLALTIAENYESHNSDITAIPDIAYCVYAIDAANDACRGVKHQLQ
jgi:hypothetical protein